MHSGDFAISVRWLARLDEDEQQRTFELSNEEGEEFTINSTELRLSEIELDKVVPAGPIPRRSGRQHASSRARNCEQNMSTKYILPAAIEQHILETLH